MTKSATHTLNLDAALARLQGNESLYGTLVSFFLDDHSHYVAQIKLGIDAGDHEAVRQAAHALKGLAAGIGGDAVVEISGAIERLARANGLSDAAELVKLDTAIEHLTTAIKPFVNSTSE